MGVPFIIALAGSRIRKYPVDELRRILADAIAPFLRGILSVVVVQVRFLPVRRMAEGRERQRSVHDSSDGQTGPRADHGHSLSQGTRARSPVLR